jgi:SSS family solute:Na+ symporter
VDTVDQLIVLLYLAVTLGLGLTRSRSVRADPDGGGAGYLLAGRRLTLPAFVATLVSTWYGGILGVGEYGYRHGLSNWLVFGLPYYLAAALFAVFLAGRAREARVLTLPEQLRAAYGRGPGGVAAAIVLLTTVPAAYLLTLGVLVRLVFGLPLWVGVVAATLFSVVYVWRTGFAAVVRTDALQFALMYGGFALLLGVLVARHGFLPFLAENVPPAHLTWHGGRPLQAILVWYVIALATLVEPSFYQRCFAARSPAVARRGILISIGCWALFDALTTATALYARALLPALPPERAAEAFPLLAAQTLPAGLAGLFAVGLFATVMSTVDSYLFVAATTVGRDLLGHGRRFAGRLPAATRWGLLVSGALALSVALSSDSVVGIWHAFGTMGTTALLAPTLSAFVPALRMSPRGALVHLLALLPTTGLWLASRAWTGDGGFWLGLEPIFPGLTLSLLVWGADRALAGRRRARRDEGSGDPRGAVARPAARDPAGRAGANPRDPSR